MKFTLITTGFYRGISSNYATQVDVQPIKVIVSTEQCKLCYEQVVALINFTASLYKLFHVFNVVYHILCQKDKTV